MISRSEWNYALGPPFLALNERVNGNMMQCDWHTSNTDLWSPAKVMSKTAMMLPVLEPWRLVERPISALPEVFKHFHSAVTCVGSIPLTKWNDFIQSRSGLEVPAQENVTLELQTLELTTGFINLICQGGSGACIRILCAEAYEQPMERRGPGAKRCKRDRTDHVGGKLYGPDDFYITHEGFNVFEPFWFRTCRYIQLEITTAQEPLTLESFTYRETYYPLDIQSSISASKEFGQMWNISLQTLRNCMHETYEDCPYYEQTQFSMDSRIQILFTYQISRDDRLARKCMYEFYASRREDGLLEAQFPSPVRSVNIPQFSLFWVLMVHDHMRYFGDRRLVKQYIGTIDGILDHFDARINKLGLVGKFDGESWPFVDWVKEWHGSTGLRSMGNPPAYWAGAATFNSLIYALTLYQAADPCAYISRHDTAKEYRARAAAANAAVNHHCFDGEMYIDGPGSKSRPQHQQVFAILSGAVTGRAATELMRKTVQDRDLPRCSYAMSFYVLRAAAKAGLYREMFPTLIEPWRKMMANNVTTWAEDDVMFRSGCHGWSCAPLHETVVQLFGLSPAEPGYRSLRLQPITDLLPKTAEGTFVTGGGHITISWTRWRENGPEKRSLTVRPTYECALELVSGNGTSQSRRILSLRKDEPVQILFPQKEEVFTPSPSLSLSPVPQQQQQLDHKMLPNSGILPPRQSDIKAC
jgi:alpha-L-rhamnosidase